MIVGVTHDPGGRVIQRLSVSTKIAIGLPPQGDRNYPTKLDHFVFLRKKRTTKGVEWEPDPELTEHYGKDCRGIRAHTGESQRVVPPAASSNHQPAQPPLQKPARQTAPADEHHSAAAKPVKTASPQPAVTAPKPNGVARSNDAQPKTSAVRGVRAAKRAVLRRSS